MLNMQQKVEQAVLYYDQIFHCFMKIFGYVTEKTTLMALLCHKLPVGKIMMESLVLLILCIVLLIVS